MPPAGLAATARCPGGYGIRPYAVGVDACIDSEPRRLPHVAFLGPLCEGAPPAGGGGENLAAIRNASGNDEVLSLRPCGPPPSQREVLFSISLFTNITRKTRPVCYKANTKKWDVPYFRHIPQILRQLFGLLPKQLHVVVVGKGNGVVARGLQRAELLAKLLRLGQHGHVVVGA